MFINKRGRKTLWISLLYRLKFLLVPAAYIYRKIIIRQVKIIAVVGSFGKTTTTRAIASALSLPVQKHRGNNVLFYLAMGILSVPPWAKYRVFEVGINKKGQMAKNANILCPDIVVVTSIGSEHGSSLGSLNNTREEKAMMVRKVPINGLVILNGDDPHVLKMKSYTKAPLITYGYRDDNDLIISMIKTELGGGTSFSLKTKNGTYNIESKLYGKAIGGSLAVAFELARGLGFEVNNIIHRLSKLKPYNERLELVKTNSGIFIY